MKIHYLSAFILTSCTGLYTTQLPEDLDLADEIKGSSEPSSESNSSGDSNGSQGGGNQGDSDGSNGSQGGGNQGGGNQGGGNQGGGNQGGGNQGGSPQPSSEPSWDTGWGGSGGGSGGSGGSTPITYILTNHWMGSGTVSTGSYTGWEGFDSNDGTYGYDQYNCQLLWDVSGVTASDTTGCPACEFTFDITVSPQSGSVDDGSCSALNGPASFGYGYSSNYEGAPAMFYRPSGDTFGVWIMDGYQPFVGYVSSVVYDASTGAFSYENGYRNYEYLYYY